ncbi:MAG: heparan-alpha-glucosaminide N-acetyltransferase [Ruminiclostridium sp.]
MGKRVGIVDEIRGIAFISMVIYHVYYDIAFIYGVNLPDAIDLIMKWLQPLIAGTFIAVAGISSNYSKNNFKRGALYFFIGMAMTFVTALVMPSEVIVFGVLHFLGIAAMIYGFVGKFTERLPYIVGIILFALLYALTINVPSGYIGFNGIFKLNLPAFLYKTDYLFPLGFPSPAFFSGDYFPLIPNLFLFFAGASLGAYFKSGRAAKGMYMTRFSGLAFIGRHGLLLYILHQPVAIAILELIFKCTGGKTIFL